jgi:hypothetical protein
VVILNLASIIIKKILDESDVETWSVFHRHYLPKEYHKVHDLISKHLTQYNHLPNFEALKLSTREPALREKIYAIERVDHTEIDCSELLDYLKNEFAQAEAMSKIEKFLESSIATSTAEEIIDQLHTLVMELEEQVDIKDPEEDMKRISLFEPQEQLEKNHPLGLNAEYDSENLFAPTDYVLIGGRRGAGKSLTCSNIASTTYEGGKSAIYFTIEMPTRQILHRICSISTGVPINAIRQRNMSVDEWRRVASWWARRFEEGEVEYQNYLSHNNFEKFHSELIRHSLRKTQIEIVYDSALTLGRIRAELDKKCKTLEPAVVIVDYINKVRTSLHSKNGQFEWTEQMAISDKLKSLAQDYNVLLVSPYQTDASGEARMAKGILDPADIAFSLDAHKQEDQIITFNCVKRRNGPEISFTSKVNWATLKIGPDTGEIPGKAEKTDEESQEL